MRLRELLNESKVEYKYFPKDKDELRSLVLKLVFERGVEADLNDIDVSNVTDMSNVLKGQSFIFNGDISKWDVSKAKHMDNMFKNSPLEGNEPGWYQV